MQAQCLSVTDSRTIYHHYVPVPFNLQFFGKLPFPSKVSVPSVPAPSRKSRWCNRSGIPYKREKNGILLHRPAAAAVPPPAPPTAELEDEGSGLNSRRLWRRFRKVAAPYWWSEDRVQARLQPAAVFALTLGTTGICVGFSFLGRDFYNALANKDADQFTKQLLYYLGAFAGGIPFFVLRDYAMEVLALRWRSWMTTTFYKIQSQSIIDNPDQRIVKISVHSQGRHFLSRRRF